MYCGSAFGTKIWHSNDQYRRVIWQCNNKYKKGEKCTTPHLDEETIKAMFVMVVNQVLADREQIIEDCEMIRQRLSDTAALEEKLEGLGGELQTVAEKIRQLVERNAGALIDQADYQKRYGALERQYQEVAERIKDAEEQICVRKAKGKDIAAFAAALRNTDRVIADFDAQLWNALVERAEVQPEKEVLFTLRNGSHFHI
jgi:chromosome segregation ATPase